MIGTIKKIKDRLGNYIFPITSTHSVYMDDGQTKLHEKLLDVDSATNEIVHEIGVLSQLPTTDKTSIVNSIKEVNTQLEQNQTQLNNLDTNKADKTEINTLATEKANKVDLNAEKSRIDNLVTTSSGSFYEKCLQTDTGTLLVVESGATTGQINLASVTPTATGYTPAAGDYVRLVYGVASGSSELIDARIGTDGKTYANTGSAVRGQIDKLSDKIDGFISDNFSKVTPKNILDPSKLLVGYNRVWTDYSQLVANESYVIWDFIPIETGRDFYFSRGNLTVQAPSTIVFWDINKNLVDYSGSANPYNITDSSVAYISIGIASTTYNAWSASLQLEYDDMTTYEPYFESYYLIKENKLGDFAELVNSNTEKITVLEEKCEELTTYNSLVDSIAHQGYNLEAPNQTLAAYKLAGKHHFDWGECDINYTSDGYYICCHNGVVYADETNKVINQALQVATGNYTTPITIAEKTLSELQTYSWGAWKSAEFSSETVPLFEDVLKICKMYGMKLFIDDFSRVHNDEIKRAEIFDIIEKYGMKDKTAFVSMNMNVPFWYDKATVIYSTSTYTIDILTTLQNYKASYPNTTVILSLNYSALTTDIVNTMHTNDIKVIAWTIDDIGTYYQWMPYVDGIVSNIYNASDVLKTV